MKKRVLALYEGYPKLKTALLLAVAALYFVIVAYSGGSVPGVLWFALVLAGYIVLPGFLAVKLLGRRGMPPGYAGPLAIVYGTGFFAVLYCVCMRLGFLWVLQLVPPLLAVAAVALWVMDRRRAGAFKQGVGSVAARFKAITPAQWLLMLLFAALLLLFTFYGAAKNGRPLAVGAVLPNHDLYWNTGNAASFKLAFPPQDIRYIGVRLHYHYLTELVAGALSLVSGLAPYDILAFYLPPFILAALVLCLFRFGRLVFPNSLFKAMLFTFSMFLFSCASLWKILPGGLSVFWNANIIHLITNINSQATAVVLLCVFAGLFIHAARRRYRVGPVHFLTLLCSYVLLCFAKGPLAALAAVAAVLAVLVGLFLKNSGWRGLVTGGCLAAIFAVVYLTMFSSGANDSMMLSAFGTLEKGWFYNILQRLKGESYRLFQLSIPFFWLAQSLLMLPAQFPLYLRGVFGDVRRFKQLSQERLFFNAMAVGGLAAYFLFNHPHMSQTYFLYAAIFFINLLAVDGTDRLAVWWGRAKAGGTGLKSRLYRGALAFVAVFAAVGVATTGFLYVHMLGSGARQLARNLGLSEKYPYELVLTADDEAAMLWLRDNTPRDAVFATNRIHTGGRMEGISNVYSALSERQAFMEGFQYAKTNMGVSADAIGARVAVNEALFSAATPPEEVLALCGEHGISYLVFTTQMAGALGEDSQLVGLPLVWHSPEVRIYAVSEG